MSTISQKTPPNYDEIVRIVLLVILVLLLFMYPSYAIQILAFAALVYYVVNKFLLN